MGKYKTKEDAKAALEATKGEKKVAFEELRAFEKANGLAKDTDHGADPKQGKKWQKLKDMHTKKKDAAAAIQAEIDAFKANKPKRVTTYDYPKDVVTAADKKKFRAKSRAAAKAKTKADAKGEKVADKKAEGKESGEKSSKKSKKAKKEAKAEKATEEAKSED